MLAEPLGAGEHVSPVIWLCRHAGKTDEGFQFVNELTAVGGEVLRNRVRHGVEHSRALL